MEYVNAHWERENLGVDVLEVRMEGNESLDKDFFEHVKNYQYVVVKVRNFSHALSQELMRESFYYVEDMMCLEGDERRFSKLLEKYNNDSITYKIDNTSADFVLGQVWFDTDRISMDRTFGAELGNKRYLNWMRFMIDKGEGQLALVYDNGCMRGFTFFTEEERKVLFLLSGIFVGERIKSRGDVIAYIQSKISLEAGKKAKIRVSSNNIKSLRIHIGAGYNITEKESVFVKHIV